MLELIMALALIGQEADAEREEDGDICAAVGSLAEQIMEARQGGTPMSELMEIAGDGPALRQLVIEAFEISRYSTPRHRERVVEDFRADAELACYRGSEQ